jgi:acyl-CoA reductase-like NAD-dependent aldehyde dehydrogenase
VVFDDANLESALNGVIAGIWGATGQSCVAGSRLIIHESIHDAFVAKLVTRASQIKIGNPHDMATEMGPLATQRQVQRAERLITESVAAGALLACGGKARSGSGHYFEPTILLSPSATLPCVTEEFFGPVLSVLKFKTEDEAVALANATKYAFAAGVFTQNLGRAHRLAKKVRAGVVWVNTYRAVSPIVPFGGNGHTGFGRESGMDAIRDYTRTKSVWINTSDMPMADPFVMR